MKTVKAFDKEDIEDIRNFLENHTFQWKGIHFFELEILMSYSDILSKDEYQVVKFKHYFREIASNSMR